MKKSWHLDRRTFLQGAGVAMALPMMESMVPVARAARAAAPKAPIRMLCVGLHLGLYAPAFFPKQTGAGYKTPQLLKPIEQYRKDFTILSGLDHGNAAGKGHKATVNYLTGTADPKKRKQMSLDQVAAKAVGSQTRFDSLQLQAGSNKRQKGQSLSWGKGGIPLPLNSNPRSVFDRLFSGPRDKGKQNESFSDSQSVLDHILEDARDMRRRLGKTDQGKLDEYMTAVREVEREIQKAEKFARKPGASTSVASAGDLKIPDKATRDVAESSRVMFQLISLAFQSDLTRVVTLRFPGENHPASHHGKKKGNLGQYVGSQKRYINELSRLLGQLRSTSDANGPLLDQTMVLFGSGMGNSSTHSTRQLPILLAGGGLKHGRHLRFAGKQKQPLSNLYVTMLQRMGVETGRFASSRGSMNSLLI